MKINTPKVTQQETEGRELDHESNSTEPWKCLDEDPLGLELPRSQCLGKRDIRRIPSKLCVQREEQGQDHGQDHGMAWLRTDLERSSSSKPPDVDQVTRPGKAVTERLENNLAAQARKDSGLGQSFLE